MSNRWWNRRKKDYVGYEVSGETISWDTAMLQAATALDHAAVLSIKENSPIGMREVAVGWLAVANTLSALSESEDEEMDLEEGSDKYPIGFRGFVEEADEDEEDYDEEE